MGDAREVGGVTGDAPKRCFPLAFSILYHPPAPCEGAVLAREGVPRSSDEARRVRRGSSRSFFSVFHISVNSKLYFAQRANIISGELNSKKQRSNSGSEIFPGTFFWNSQARRASRGGDVGGGASGPPRAPGSRRTRRYVPHVDVRVSQLSGDDRAFQRPRPRITFLRPPVRPFHRPGPARSPSTHRLHPPADAGARSCARRASAAPSAIAARSSTRRIARTRRRARG